MNEMIYRVEAAQKTLNEWRNRSFRYGRSDCARMVASHLRRMGHRVKLPASGSYASPRSALKELKARGWSDLLSAMDGMGFERIPPAAALTGDVIALPGDSAIGCLTVALGNGRVCGYHEDVAGVEVLQPVAYEAAWRV